jgi:hypothetical protein
MVFLAHKYANKDKDPHWYHSIPGQGSSEVAMVASMPVFPRLILNLLTPWQLHKNKKTRSVS